MLLAKSDKKTKRQRGLEYTRPGKALFREGGPDVCFNSKDHKMNVRGLQVFREDIENKISRAKLFQRQKQLAQ